MKNVLIACLVLVGLSANAQNEEINGGPNKRTF